MNKEIKKDLKIVEAEVGEEVKGNFAKYLFLLVASVLIMVISFHFRGSLAQLKSFGLLGIFLINFIGNATVFIPFPTIPIAIVGGALYGTLAAGFAAGVGAGLGEIVGYGLGKSSREVLFKKETAFHAVIRKYFKKWGSITIFIFAFLPDPFFDAIGIMAGHLSYSVRRFLLLTIAGRVARSLIFAYLGAKL